MQVGMVAKKMFFDAPRVARSMDRATRKVLSRFGAFVRRRARSSIRKRKKVSAPGQPPSSHSGHLKRGIYFGYDTAKRSVVIGPTPQHKVYFDDAMRPVRGTVPSVLESGGEIYVLEEWTGSGWRRRDLRRMGSVADVAALRQTGRTNVFSAGRPIRKRRVSVRARPYMGPAFAAELPGLPAMWKNSVRP